MRGKSARRQGKQHSAPGTAMAQVERPDESVECPPSSCAGRGGDLADALVYSTQKRHVRGRRSSAAEGHGVTGELQDLPVLLPPSARSRKGAPSGGQESWLARSGSASRSTSLRAHRDRLRGAGRLKVSIGPSLPATPVNVYVVGVGLSFTKINPAPPTSTGPPTKTSRTSPSPPPETAKSASTTKAPAASTSSSTAAGTSPPTKQPSDKQSQGRALRQGRPARTTAIGDPDHGHDLAL
jgi:hypothetical protein